MMDSLKSSESKGGACPFLEQIGRKGLLADLIPPFAFEPDAAFIAGLYPEEANEGMHFWREPAEQAILRILGRYGNPLDRLPDAMDRSLRKALQAWFRVAGRTDAEKYFLSPAKIPFRFMGEFSAARKKMLFEEEYTAAATVFEIVRKENQKWLYFGYPVSNSRIDQICRDFESRQEVAEAGFIFVMANELDKAGHRFGASSAERREILRKVSSCLERLYQTCERYWKSFNFIIFGDHGHVDVKGTVNVQAVLEKAPARVHEDYSYFLDSTVARFWFHNSKAARWIQEALERLDGGSIIDEKEKARYRIRYPHNRFGDLFYWADGGNVIAPDFFNGNRPPKGMHGYRAECEDNHSAFAACGPGFPAAGRLPDPADMVRVYPTLLQSLGLKCDLYSKLAPIQ